VELLANTFAVLTRFGEHEAFDALWKALVASPGILPEEPPLPGIQLFLAGLYWLSVRVRNIAVSIYTAGLPQGYGT
jgi:hypothetical protein